MAWHGESARHSWAARKRCRRTVKGITDGDTFVVNRKIGGSNRVRLAGYDAPESYQFGGRAATNKLRGLIGGKRVSITPVGRSYGRIVAKVTQNRKNINKRMRY